MKPYIFGIILLFIVPGIISQGDEMEEAEPIKSTTPNPVTTTPNPVTTTPQSSSPSTISTTTTPKPYSPIFPNNIGRWNVIYPDSEQNASCIIFQGAVQLRAKNVNNDNTSVLVIDVPRDAESTGTCGNMNQTLTLSWTQNSASNTSVYSYKLETQFGITSFPEHEYDIQKFTLMIEKYNLSTEGKVGEVNSTLNLEGPYFQVKFNNSYICVSQSKLSGNDLTVVTSSLQFEAFRPKNSSSQNFSEPQICKMDSNTYATVIGIALGSLLAILLAIGLGMYVGIRYGYCHWPCCTRRSSGYQRLDI